MLFDKNMVRNIELRCKYFTCKLQNLLSSVDIWLHFYSDDEIRSHEMKTKTD